MLFSRHTENDKFSLYALFLKHLIAGELGYKELVDPVIEDAHLLVINERDFVTIDRENYPIIVYLFKKDMSSSGNINNLLDSNFQNFNYLPNKILIEDMDMALFNAIKDFNLSLGLCGIL